jgi:uncharacterized membrane protein
VTDSIGVLVTFAHAAANFFFNSNFCSVDIVLKLTLVNVTFPVTALLAGGGGGGAGGVGGGAGGGGDGSGKAMTCIFKPWLQ